MKKSVLFALSLFIVCTNVHYANGQNKIRLDKITAESFNVHSPLIDTNANAVILKDIGVSTFEGNDKGWFTLIYTRARQVKILNKKGFDEANITISLYRSSNQEEQLENVKAVTYNLEGGKVKETTLDRKSIFREKYDKNYTLAKFSLPEITENSIIEYTYTIKSDFLFNLQPWTFQDYKNPVLFSSYEVGIPQFFNYVFLAQGFIPIKKETNSSYRTFSVSNSATSSHAANRATLSGEVFYTKWTAENIPALKEEPFVASLKNNLSKVEFQLSQYRFPNTPVEDVMGNWNKVAEKWYEHEEIYKPITMSNTWLNDDMKTIVKGSTDKEKAESIYNYVRDNFTAVKRGLYFEDNNGLRNVFKTKKGNVAEINLLMIAMLKNAGLYVDPVIVSTRDNGYAHQFYPLVSKYNYLIAKCFIDGKDYFLDATQPKTAFGKLPHMVYNGYAEVMTKNPYGVVFDTDSIMEASTTIVFLVNDKNTKKYTGNYVYQMGTYESIKNRADYEGKDLKDFQKKIKSTLGEVEVANFAVDSMSKYEYPLKLSCNLNYDFEDKDIIYFNPSFKKIGINPFTADTRVSPVELPNAIKDFSTLVMEIPTGYKVEELPKSLKLSLNESDGSYDYLIGVVGNTIQLRSTLNIKKTYFSPNDYQTLREFFSHVIKKQAEQIVLKKIN